MTPIVDAFLYYVYRSGSLVLARIDAQINTGSCGGDLCAPYWFLGVLKLL